MERDIKIISNIHVIYINPDNYQVIEIKPEILKKVSSST